MMQFARDYEAGMVILDGEWEPETLFSYELLEQSDRDILRRDGDEIRITVANGRARYKIIEEQPEYARVKAVLESGEIYDATSNSR